MNIIVKFSTRLSVEISAGTVAPMTGVPMIVLGSVEPNGNRLSSELNTKKTMAVVPTLKMDSGKEMAVLLPRGLNSTMSVLLSRITVYIEQNAIRIYESTFIIV